LLQNGEIAAFDEIFDIYKDKAVRTAFLITGNQSICEDIVQESFIQCYKNIDKLRNPEGFKSWFYKILTRTAWKYGKSANKEVATESILETAEYLSFDTSMEQHIKDEANRLLYSEINQLEPNQKTVIILYYFIGLSTKEIASAVGCFEGTVKSRLFNARKKLKNIIELSECQGKELPKNAKYKII
jgi:RNA polymerase sigma-70 factor (ECF subfamily)